MMAAGKLEQNREFVQKNRSDLLKTYEGKYMVVFDCKVTGAFDIYQKAVEEAIRMHGQDAEFLVHHLTKSESVNFVMRASF